MELSLLALQAAKIAIWALDKTSGGALEKAGADVLDLLRKKFQGKLQISKEAQPQQLQAQILGEAERDKRFHEDLHRLVSWYQKIESNSSFSQSTQSGVSISVNTNTGKVTGQEINNFFR